MNLNNNIISLNELIIFEKGKNPEELFSQQLNNSIRYLNLDAFNNNSLTYVTKNKHVISSELDFSMVMDGSSSGKIVFGLSGAIASTLARIQKYNMRMTLLLFHNFLICK